MFSYTCEICIGSRIAGMLKRLMMTFNIEVSRFARPMWCVCQSDVFIVIRLILKYHDILQ